MSRFLVPTTVALAVAGALGASVPDGTWPTSQGNVSYTEVYVIAAGETFDGGMKTYDRSDITCEGQEESGTSTAVFSLEAGATLKNAIIGTNQMEGVHCDDSDCTIENVWWEDVCEDALSIKGGSSSSVSTVTGGGARYADDKVVQHNGYGSVVIDGFYAEDFGKLYRSCGTCGDRQRFVNVSNVYAVDPGVSIVTVNENYGDEAILKNIYISADDDSYVICGWSEGTDGDEPTELGDGISYPLCQYSESDIHINEGLPSSSSTDSSSASTSTTTTTTSSSTSSTSGVDTEAEASSSAESAYTSAPSSAVSSSDSSGSTAEEESWDSSDGSDTTPTATSTEASSAEEADSNYTNESSASGSSETASTSSYADETASASSYSEETTSTTSTEVTFSSASSAASAPSAADEAEASSSSSSATDDDGDSESIADEGDATSESATEAEDDAESDAPTASEADDAATATTTPSKCSVRRRRD